MPKHWTNGHHEALRALLSFCYVFPIFLCCFLFASDELYFVFFMEWVVVNVDQCEMCVVFGRDP